MLCQSFVLYLPVICPVFVLHFAGRLPFVLCLSCVRPAIVLSFSWDGVAVVIGRITEAAKRVGGFEKLPMTTQIGLLLAEIEEARRMRIPLAIICEEMNAAGSAVTVGYLRRALSVVRKRMDGQETQPAAAPSPTPPRAKPTKREALEEKAGRYMGSDNPLLNSLNKRP